MSNDIDTRITVSLHQSVVAKIEGHDDPDIGPLLAPTVTAFSTAYNAIRAVWETRAIVGKNRGWTDEQKIIHLAKFAEKKSATAAHAFDSTMATLKKQIAHYEAELSAPIEASTSVAFAAEIRSHVKGMKAEDRLAFVQRALSDGDTVSMKALLSAPSYLSGITPDMQKIYLRHYHESVSPVQAKRLKALEGARDLIMEHASKMHGEFDKAVGASQHHAAALRHEQDAADAALAK